MGKQNPLLWTFTASETFQQSADTQEVLKPSMEADRGVGEMTD